MGRRQVWKLTRRSSRRRWEHHRFLHRHKGTDMDMDPGKMGTWTYGTRCRLATSTYSFRFPLALEAHHVSGTG